MNLLKLNQYNNISSSALIALIQEDWTTNTVKLPRIANKIQDQLQYLNNHLVENNEVEANNETIVNRENLSSRQRRTTSVVIPKRRSPNGILKPAQESTVLSKSKSSQASQASTEDDTLSSLSLNISKSTSSLKHISLDSVPSKPKRVTFAIGTKDCEGDNQVKSKKVARRKFKVTKFVVDDEEVEIIPFDHYVPEVKPTSIELPPLPLKELDFSLRFPNQQRKRPSLVNAKIASPVLSDSGVDQEDALRIPNLELISDLNSGRSCTPRKSSSDSPFSLKLNDDLLARSPLPKSGFYSARDNRQANPMTLTPRINLKTCENLRNRNSEYYAEVNKNIPINSVRSGFYSPSESSERRQSSFVITRRSVLKPTLNLHQEY